MSAAVVRLGPGRRLLTLVVALALACLGMVVAPAAGAATYGPGSLTVTPSSVAAGTSGATLVMRYTASSASFTGAVTVVVPTSGAPATGFRPIPSTSSVRVARGTCAAVVLVPTFGTVTVTGYPGDSPGTRVTVAARCAAGKSFTITYSGVTVPRTAQPYTFRATAGGAPLRVQPVVAVTPLAAASLAVSAPASAVAGTPFAVDVVAKDRYGNVATGYRGTVRLSTTDPLVRALPGAYTFTSADRGAHRFSGVTLVSTGTQRVDAADKADGRIHGSDSLTVRGAGVTVWGSVLYDFDPFGFAAHVMLVDAVSGKTLRTVDLAPWEDGFRFEGLPAGAFVIKVTSPGFVTSPASGVPVAALAPGQSTDWTEVEMVDNPSDRAAVEGQVLSEMDPIAVPAWVTVYDATTMNGLGAVRTDSSGYYRIEGLPPIRVIIGAQATGYAPGWANNRDSAAEADVFTLVSGQTLRQSWDPEDFGPYLDLNPEPRTAVLEGQVLSQMDPIQGEATVTVYDAVTGAPLASGQTVNQQYRIEGLPAGQVKVGATAPGYLEGFANNADTLAAATAFTLVEGQTLTQSWDPENFGPYLDLDPASS